MRGEAKYSFTVKDIVACNFCSGVLATYFFFLHLSNIIVYNLTQTQVCTCPKIDLYTCQCYGSTMWHDTHV